MGYDTFEPVSIVSMNSARQSINGLPRQKRGSYLDGLLKKIRPDIGVLPFDDPELKNNTIVDYEQHMSEDKKTLLLYDAKKVTMKAQPDCHNIFNGLRLGVNEEQIAWPEVQIMAPKPYTGTVIKQFSLVAISHTMFDVDDVTEQERRFNLLIVLFQRLAMTNGRPVLAAGDFRLSTTAVHSHLNRQNETLKSQFLDDAYENLRQQFGFLRSMTQESTREYQDLFKFAAVQCKRSESVVKQWQPEHADCFIASKALQMSEPKTIKVDKALGRQVKVAPAKKEFGPPQPPSCKTTSQSHMHESCVAPAKREFGPVLPPSFQTASRPYVHEPCVTRTEMQIPARPPRHHGG